MFTARYGLIPYIKQITFGLLEVNNVLGTERTLSSSLALSMLGHGSV